MTAFLQTWKDGAQTARSREGRPLDHAASEQYAGMGVTAGDVLYIAYLERGALHLIGRLPVAEIVDQRRAEELFDAPVWQASFHAVGPGGDPMAFGLVVPDDVIERLRFSRATGEPSRLERSFDGSISGQSLQRIRRLTADSAALLDEVLAGA
jgi:hypothetical protein